MDNERRVRFIITLFQLIHLSVIFRKETSSNSPFSILHCTLYIIYYLAFMGEYSLGDAMKYFLQRSKLKGPLQAVQIEEVWSEIMGTTIAKYTDKIQIFNGTLFITTQVAALKQELLFQKEKIKERVNEALGEKVITEVVIK